MMKKKELLMKSKLIIQLIKYINKLNIQINNIYKKNLSMIYKMDLKLLMIKMKQ